MIVVYAYVVGDLFHIGHLRMLQKAAKMGDRLVVGVITDEGVERYKRTPIIPFSERIEIISNVRCVDAVITQHDVDPTNVLETLRPDILVHGDDWGDDFPGASYMRRIGKEVRKTTYYPYQNTTKIIRKVKESECE